MPFSTRKTALAAAAAFGLLALAACGGGGGGEAMPTAKAPPPTQNEQDGKDMTGTDPAPAMPTTLATELTEADYTPIAQAGLMKTAETMRKIAEGTPNFGSVTQTTSGALKSTAEFDIDTRKLEVTFRSGEVTCSLYPCFFNMVGIDIDGGNPKFGTNPQVDTVKGQGGYPETHQVIAGEITRGGVYRDDIGDDKDVVAHGNFITRWFGDEESVHNNDWSIRGYYLAYAGSNLLRTDPARRNLARDQDITHMAFTTFIEGPEYDGEAKFPSRETIDRFLATNEIQPEAYYSGNAYGFATFEYANDAKLYTHGRIRQRPRGSIVGADWSGEVVLDADFATNTIDGSIHSIRIDEWVGSGDFVNEPEAFEYVFPGIEDRRVIINLAETEIGKNGFVGTTHLETWETNPKPGHIDDLLIQIPLESSSGKYGGRFSTKNVLSNQQAIAMSVPRSIGGTVGVTGTKDGVTVTFGGSFEAFE